MSCSEKATSVYHIAGANVGVGTQVAIPDYASGDAKYKTVTVVNDTDQDVKVEYITSTGHVCNFVVPKSIRGFTKQLKGDATLTSPLKVISMHSSAAAVGNIIFNFGV